MSTTEIDWIIKVEEGDPIPFLLGHKLWFWYVVEKRTAQLPHGAEPLIIKTPYSDGTSWSRERAIKAAKKYVDDVMEGRARRQESDNDILYRGEEVDL